MNNCHSDKFPIPLILIAGPTAVGKTAISLELAKRLNTEIISADSAQIYRFLDIGTAKPDPFQKAMVRHHLIDLINPDESYSVAAYQKVAQKTVSLVSQRGMIPFVVGGSGLYIEALTAGYVFGSRGRCDSLRKELEEKARVTGKDALHKELTGVDPQAAAEINPADLRRVIRALEVFYLSGRPISAQREDTESRPSPYSLHAFVLTMERCRLYERIEQRVDEMFSRGLVAEVEALLQQGYSSADPGLKVLGYRQVTDYLLGRLGHKEALARIKKDTRNLAKRQLTWFRSRLGRASWIDVTELSAGFAAEEIIYPILQDKGILRAN